MRQRKVRGAGMGTTGLGFWAFLPGQPPSSHSAHCLAAASPPSYLLLVQDWLSVDLPANRNFPFPTEWKTHQDDRINLQGFNALVGFHCF